LSYRLTWSAPVARVIVDVMLKPEILDPQGQAIAGALARLGHSTIASVRQGKHFELEVDGPADEAVLAEIHEVAGSLLSNPVIEDFVVRLD
jgi:phosphoribosylformylglycinamidine synthase PurS subunit